MRSGGYPLCCAAVRILVFASILAACGGGGENPSDAAADASPDQIASDAPFFDAGADASIPKLKLDLTSTSVSGISSGGYMAVQFHVAFSSMMKGAAIFAAGPYDCSQGSIQTALGTCSSGSPDVASLVSITKQYAQAGSIDDPSALASQRVFLFGGADDVVVAPTVVDSLHDYYASFMATSSIDYVSRRAGTSHTWPTLAYGSPCDVVSSPYLGKCSYDGAGAALQQIFGTLAVPAATPSGAIVTLSQGAFIADPSAASLDDVAYLYVPPSCSSGDTCKLHIAFHGCLQGASLVGDAFYAHAGLNEWADTNHFVVLYPQVKKSTTNPEGCWDWWGYTGADFAKKTGPQMSMVRAMITGIAQ
jgi:poly(3-hydroxybutyrate) depolymerase